MVATDTTDTCTIDSVRFFEVLADAMNADPTRFEVLGDVTMNLALVMRRPGADAFGVVLGFDGIRCDGVAGISPGEERQADCWLEGDLGHWQAMFDDIAANGRATGRQTINSLTLLGDHIAVHGADPLGVDRFFRYNQTVQALLDGAAEILGPQDGEAEPRNRTRGADRANQILGGG